MLLRDNLDELSASRNIEVLELPLPLSDVLNQHEVETIGDIYGLQVEGLAHLAGLDEVQASEIWQTAVNYVSNPPEEVVYETPKVNLPEILPDLIKEIYDYLNNDRLHIIVVQRFGLDGHRSHTLQEIGESYDISRERIRQLEKNALKILVTALDGSTARLLKHLKLENDIIEEAGRLKTLLESGAPIIAQDALFEKLGKIYNMELDERQQSYMGVLLHGWEWKQIETDITTKAFIGINFNTFWVLPDAQINVERVARCCKKIVKVLYKYPKGINYPDLAAALNQTTTNNFDDPTVRGAIAICADLEILANGNLHIRFEKLRNAADQAYHILFEHGSPLSFRDIHKELTARLAETSSLIPRPRSVTSQMVLDPRFIPIGRSGEWALSEWPDVIPDTIIDLMIEFFHKNKKPGKSKQVFEYVIARRPASSNSVSSYLNDHPSFQRVGEGLYQLSIWVTPETEYTPRRRKRMSWIQLAQEVVKVFDERGTPRMPLTELARDLKIALGRSQIAYVSLQKCPVIEIVPSPENANKRDVILAEDYEDRITNHNKVTSRDRIHTAVRDTLKMQPDFSMQMRLLKDEVINKTDVSASAFYRYLSEMTDIQKTPIPGENSVFCVLVDVDKE